MLLITQVPSSPAHGSQSIPCLKSAETPPKSNNAPRTKDLIVEIILTNYGKDILLASSTWDCAFRESTRRSRGVSELKPFRWQSNRTATSIYQSHPRKALSSWWARDFARSKQFGTRSSLSYNCRYFCHPLKK